MGFKPLNFVWLELYPLLPSKAFSPGHVSTSKHHRLRKDRKHIKASGVLLRGLSSLMGEKSEEEKKARIAPCREEQDGAWARSPGTPYGVMSPSS